MMAVSDALYYVLKPWKHRTFPYFSTDGLRVAWREGPFRASRPDCVCHCPCGQMLLLWSFAAAALIAVLSLPIATLLLPSLAINNVTYLLRHWSCHRKTVHVLLFWNPVDSSERFSVSRPHRTQHQRTGLQRVKSVIIENVRRPMFWMFKKRREEVFVSLPKISGRKEIVLIIIKKYIFWRKEATTILFKPIYLKSNAQFYWFEEIYCFCFGHY